MYNYDTFTLPIQSRSSYADLISFQYCPFLKNIKQLFSKSYTLSLSFNFSFLRHLIWLWRSFIFVDKITSLVISNFLHLVLKKILSFWAFYFSPNSHLIFLKLFLIFRLFNDLELLFTYFFFKVFILKFSITSVLKFLSFSLVNCSSFWFNFEEFYLLLPLL